MRKCLTAVVVALLFAGCGKNNSRVSATLPPTAVSPNTEAPVSTAAPPTTVAPGVTRTLTPTSGFFAGWRYGVTVRFGRTDPSPSPGGCVGPAAPGRTNVWFNVLITNEITDRPAPLPHPSFATNLTNDGTAVVGATDLASLTFHTNPLTGEGVVIAMLPLGGDSVAPDTRECLYGTEIGDEGVTIPASSTLTFTGVLGPVANPPPSGFLLLVNVHENGGLGDNFSVPFESGTA